VKGVPLPAPALGGEEGVSVHFEVEGCLNLFVEGREGIFICVKMQVGKKIIRSGLAELQLLRSTHLLRSAFSAILPQLH